MSLKLSVRWCSCNLLVWFPYGMANIFQRTIVVRKFLLYNLLIKLWVVSINLIFHNLFDDAVDASFRALIIKKHRQECCCKGETSTSMAVAVDLAERVTMLFHQHCNYSCRIKWWYWKYLCYFIGFTDGWIQRELILLYDSKICASFTG